MGDNKMNWVPRSLKDEFDLNDPYDQDLFIQFVSLAENDTIVKVIEPILPTMKSDPSLDVFVVKLAIQILNFRSSHLTETDRENYRQVLIHLMSDEIRAQERNTIYQLIK